MYTPEKLEVARTILTDDRLAFLVNPLYVGFSRWLLVENGYTPKQIDTFLLGNTLATIIGDDENIFGHWDIPHDLRSNVFARFDILKIIRYEVTTPGLPDDIKIKLWKYYLDLRKKHCTSDLDREQIREKWKVEIRDYVREQVGINPVLKEAITYQRQLVSVIHGPYEKLMARIFPHESPK